MIDEKQIKSDLESLNDDEFYYGKEGQKYLSASTIKTLVETPHLYGVQQEDSLQFLMGKYFHTMILEPEKLVNFHIIDIGSRNTKVYKEYLLAEGLAFALLRKEVDGLHDLKESLLAKEVLKQLVYTDGNEFEKPMIKEIHGKLFKGKADIVNHENQLVIDLKTTGDINRFKNSAWQYYYNSQAWIYRELFGYDVVFIVCDKKTNVVQLFTCSDKFYQVGEERVLQAIENFDMFYGTDSYEDITQYVPQFEL